VTVELFSNVLVLAPHTDDGELGCGGTMARFVEEGARVTYAAFSIATRSVPDGFPRDILATEVRHATAAIGIPEDDLRVFDFEVRTFPANRQEILERLIEIQNELQPDLVLMPSLNDLHQDHQTIAQEGLRAFKRTTLLGYEIPWNNITFNHQVYVTLQQRHIDKKVAALLCYQSQQHRNYAREDYVRNLAFTRAIDVGRDLAEVFELYRWVV
jgi:LmbE family N-acetylglucosaminyl deacetylase